MNNDDNLDSLYRSREQFMPQSSGFQESTWRAAEQQYRAEAGIIDATIAYLDERIAYYKSTDAIDHKHLFRRRDANHVLAANKITVDNLEQERSRLLALQQAFDEET